MTDQPAAPTPPEPASGAPNAEELPAPATPAAVSSHAADGSWPSSAKTLTVLLAIGVVAAIVAAIAGFSQASSADDDKAVLEADRGAAIAQADAAEQERDDLAAEVAELGSSIDTLTAERDDAVDAQDQLTNDLAAETERADAAEAVLEQLQVIAGQFPISLDSSLIPEDMPGSYEITYQEAYCDGFSTCGTLPTVSEATVYTTSEGFLRVEVDGILDAGLFALDGSLYGITDSLTALPACGGADTRARVTITMYAGAISVADDGTRTVNDVNASITIDAPSNGPDCPSGLVFYASSFTPVT